MRGSGGCRNATSPMSYGAPPADIQNVAIQHLGLVGFVESLDIGVLRGLSRCSRFRSSAYHVVDLRFSQQRSLTNPTAAINTLPRTQAPAWPSVPPPVSAVSAQKQYSDASHKDWHQTPPKLRCEFTATSGQMKGWNATTREAY